MGRDSPERLETLPAEEVVGVAIVTVEEQMRGWLAAVARERTARRQVTAYRELANLFDFFAAFSLAPFDEQAADQFDFLRSAKSRLGTMDLWITNTCSYSPRRFTALKRVLLRSFASCR